MMSSVSVVINTFNEEAHIARAIESVASWAKEIIIVDMFSHDKTVSIAKDMGARVLMHEPVGYVEPAREFAVASASGPWVLILDADELIPKKLAEVLVGIAQSGCCDACKLPRMNYFFGAPVMHSGWGPDEDRQLRFFKKGCVTFSHIIHSIPQIVEGARLRVLDYASSGAIIHFPYLDFSQFVKKLDSYTNVEAAQMHLSGASSTYFRAVLAMGKEFFLRFIVRQGFRDGWRGFYLSAMMMFYRLLTYAKAKESTVAGTKEDVSKVYTRIAQSYIDEYKK